MGLFSKKDDKKGQAIPKLPELPSLPSLPSLPVRFPDMKGAEDEDIPELPSFPTGGMGEKFSRDSIKNAVSGDDEDEAEITPEDVMPRPPSQAPQRPMSMENIRRVEPMSRAEKRQIPREEPARETGPVFIRIDKFEEALSIFKGTREKIDEIEKLLAETKEVKEKEDEELSTWEEEIQAMKQQIEKVDRDIFSRV